MKIVMTTSMVGADFALSVGDETERFGSAEAIRLIEAGYAVPAVSVEVENTAAPVCVEKRGRKKKA